MRATDEASGPTLAPAHKLRHPDLPAQVRVLVPEGGAPPLVLHKELFEYGGQAQLFAGLFAGRPVVVRRVSALDAHHPEGIRDCLRSQRGHDDTQSLPAIARDVRVAGRVAAARGQIFAALATGRAGAAGPAKIWEVLAPRHGDLIEVIQNLVDAPRAVVAAVAGVAIGTLARDVERLAALGIVHADLGAHNVLIGHAAGEPLLVEAADFGLVEEVAPAHGLSARAQSDLGRLLATLLWPQSFRDLGQRRCSLSTVLAGARAAVPGLAAVAADLIDGRIPSAAALGARLAAAGGGGEEALALALPVFAAVGAKAREIHGLAEATLRALGEAEALGTEFAPLSAAGRQRLEARLARWTGDGPLTPAPLLATLVGGGKRE